MRRLAWTLAAPLLLLPASADADVSGDDPVLAEITSPTEGQMFEGPVASIDVVLAVSTGAYGVSSIDLMLDGETIATDNAEPWGFAGIEVGVGTHTLATVAYSGFDGTGYSSTPVQIVVFDGDGGTGSGTGTGTESTSDTDQNTNDDRSGKKCSVDDTTTGPGELGLLLLIGVSLAALRRRRRER